MRLRTLFRVAAGLLVIAAVVHVSTVWPRVLTLAGVLPARSWLLGAAFAVSAATALGACGLAVMLLWKAPDRADARALTFFLCFLALYWGSLFRFVQVEAQTDSFSINLSYGDNWIGRAAILSFLFAVAAYLRFSALFPRPLTPDRLPPTRSPRWLRRLRAAYLGPAAVWGSLAAIVVLQEIGPRIVARLVDLDPAIAEQAGGPPRSFLVTLIAMAVLYIGASLSALVLGVHNLRDSYRLAAPDERKHLMWVVGGFSIAAWMIVGSIGLLVLIVTADISATALGAAIPLAIVFAPAVLVTSAAIGILYSGAIDPALVVRRSTMYGFLGVLGLITFAGIENALSNLVEQRLRLPGFVGAMLAGGLVTAALIPVRSAIRAWLKRNAAALPVQQHSRALEIAHNVAPEKVLDTLDADPQHSPGTPGAGDARATHEPD